MLLLAATAWRLQRKLAHTDSWPGDEALMPPHHWYDTPLNFLMAGVFALAVVWLHYHAGPLPYFAGLNYLAKASPSEIVLQALLLLGSAVCLSVSQRRVKRWSLLAFVGAMRSIAAWVFIFASPALGLVLMMQAAVARSLLRQEQQ
ncbi:hypothetical protein [Andreprevotia lacus]|nr:hypothetical protein [Andreprevotia lacus]